ncbi:MAG: Mu transposase C-terminal domain-containing protein [Lachnospiraceae bacterium]
MLKERYCDAAGKLLPEYPSIHQFRYFYRKHKDLRGQYISKDGKSAYQRKPPPPAGDGVQAFAPAVGVGMLDATVCDIYLVNEAGGLVGRPILTACVDAYSDLCCGYMLSWEGGTYSLRGLMLNVLADKQEHCRKHGIEIERNAWDCGQLPATLVTDMGSEYVSETFGQIADLGVTLVHLPAYRPELKGPVEKFFDLVQESYKPYLKGRGVIEPDFQERGAHDYRKDACLTMEDFEKVILRCILYYNTRRVLENFPYTEEILAAGVRPHASDVWNYGKTQPGASLIPVTRESLILTLFPRVTGRFSKYGLKVNRMRYKNEHFADRFLRGGTVTVAYNPEDVSMVWLIEDGRYLPFDLIEGRYAGKSLEEVQGMQEAKKRLVRAAAEETIQAKIDLADHIGHDPFLAEEGHEAGRGAAE